MWEHLTKTEYYDRYLFFIYYQRQKFPGIGRIVIVYSLGSGYRKREPLEGIVDFLDCGRIYIYPSSVLADIIVCSKEKNKKTTPNTNMILREDMNLKSMYGKRFIVAKQTGKRNIKISVMLRQTRYVVLSFYTHIEDGKSGKETRLVLRHPGRS